MKAELGDSRPESTGLPGPPGSGRAGTNAVLIVEDQPELLRALSINLRARQYDVLTARTGREALAVAASHPPDAVILDLGLPDIDGTEVIVELRRWSKAPIIVLSGRSSPGDKIGALDVGADDYVTKPFAMAELLARLRAALRRDEGEANLGRPHQATIGRWLVNLTSHQVTRAAAGSAPAAEPATDSAPAAGPGPSPHPGSAGGGGLSAGRAGGDAAPDADRVADPGDPAPASRPAGRVGADPDRGVGPRLLSAHQLSPLPHGPAAPQAGGQPGPAASPAHRTRHGLPLPAVTSRIAVRGVRGPAGPERMPYLAGYHRARRDLSARRPSTPARNTAECGAQG